MKYDYIIVGAGSAGCVLATRLTENKDVNVLLVEAGRKDHRADFRIHMPAALAFPLQGKTYNWYYESLPDPYMNNRKMYCPRGKVLGGSSSINGMCYIRGHAMDFERWADETGFTEWDYKHCLAYFKKSEQFSEGENDYHGGDGYLGVTRSKQSHPLFKAFIKAGIEAGYLETDDLNGFQQEGFGPMDRSTFRGRRHSTARAYLSNAMERKNLTVLTHHHVHRVLFKDKQAVGIEVEATNSSGQKQTIYANDEVILSAGAIGSPQLLLLSGIGHEKELNQLGIECISHLPGVGENLQDHLEVYVQYACKEPVSLYSATKWYNQLKIGAEWLFLRQGVGASNQFEAGGFIYSDKDIFNHPNLQYHFIPLAMNYDGSKMQGQHGYQAHVAPMRPESKGFVKLNSNNALSPPDILFNYMSTERDQKEMRDGVRLTREILTQPAFSEFRGVELSPGLDIQSDDEIDNYVREHGESAMHPACTCKMGDLDNDNMSVVNNEGKVYGVERLRVIDASIMPSIISGNLNATTIMIAEKMADKLRHKPHAQINDISWYERSQT